MDKPRHPHVIRTWRVERTRLPYRPPQPAKTPSHLARIIMGLPVVVQGVSVPVWVSIVALLVTAFLSYEGFHLARRVRPK